MVTNFNDLSKNQGTYLIFLISCNTQLYNFYIGLSFVYIYTDIGMGDIVMYH